jgi:hypothetical protein
MGEFELADPGLSRLGTAGCSAVRTHIPHLNKSGSGMTPTEFPAPVAGVQIKDDRVRLLEGCHG